MGLVDVVEARDIEQMRQALLGALDRLKEIVEDLRDGSEIDISINVKFRAKGKP